MSKYFCEDHGYEPQPCVEEGCDAVQCVIVTPTYACLTEACTFSGPLDDMSAHFREAGHAEFTTKHVVSYE